MIEHSSGSALCIRLGARNSPLSVKQYEEFVQQYSEIYPQTVFSPHFLSTTGDRNQRASLMVMDKSDFFTRELDQLLLEGEIDMALHSAKDLPDPMPKGLCIAAITKGVDPRDALVLRPGESLKDLPAGSRIGVSSIRRVQMVKRLRDDCLFAEIRGTIEKRLNQLMNHRFDAVVVAEAALIRLGLTHLNRILLEGETAPLQGKLAAVTQEENMKLIKLLAPLDIRVHQKEPILS